MSNAGTAIIATDGASRGNPGPAAYAFVLEYDGTIIEEKQCIGVASNNVAEYTGLIRALEKAIELGAERVEIQTDSELIVRQLEGKYKVKSPNLRPLFDKVQLLRRRFSSFAIKHVPRERNRRADKLCNEALDAEKKGRAARANRTKEKSPPQDATADAIACLRSAAEAWAAGDPNDPPPEMVWEQLWSILVEKNVIR